MSPAKVESKNEIEVTKGSVSLQLLNVNIVIHFEDVFITGNGPPLVPGWGNICGGAGGVGGRGITIAGR